MTNQLNSRMEEANKTLAMITELEKQLKADRAVIDIELQKLSTNRRLLEGQIGMIVSFDGLELTEEVDDALAQTLDVINSLVARLLASREVSDEAEVIAVPNLDFANATGIYTVPLSTMRIMRSAFTGDNPPGTLLDAIKHAFGSEWNTKEIRRGKESVSLGTSEGQAYMLALLGTVAKQLRESDGGRKFVDNRKPSAQTESLFEAIGAADRYDQIIAVLRQWGVEI